MHAAFSAVAVLGLVLTGVVAAGLLPAVCPTTGVINCQSVLTGPGSHLVGLPLALWGSLWGVAGWGAMGWSSRWPWLPSVWRTVGELGLVWAWAHEALDHHLCLWCSSLQAAVLVAIGCSIAWPVVRHAWQRTLHQLQLSHVRWGLITGAVSAGLFAANQWRIGSNVWGWIAGVSLVWGMTIAGLTTLAWLWMDCRSVGRLRRFLPSASPAVGLLASVTITACSSGLCTVGAGLTAPLAALGLAGLLNASALAFLPFYVLIGLSLIGVLGVWEAGIAIGRSLPSCAIT